MKHGSGQFYVFSLYWLFPHTFRLSEYPQMPEDFLFMVDVRLRFHLQVVDEIFFSLFFCRPLETHCHL